MSISGIPSSTFSQYPLSAASKLCQQDWKQLGQDLKSGNLSAAQQDLSALQQDLQSQGDSSVNLYHNHHRLAVPIGELTNQNSLLQQLNQLGQDLASGNLSASQQAYAALQEQSTVSTIGGRHHTSPPVKGSTISAVA
ncbi:MAG: hypothetical protein LAO30_10470 [Acidobacteriia bacterium]|nr:hypothetical protein [Terriglobia bacterium]